MLRFAVVLQNRLIYLQDRRKATRERGHSASERLQSTLGLDHWLFSPSSQLSDHDDSTKVYESGYSPQGCSTPDFRQDMKELAAFRVAEASQDSRKDAVGRLRRAYRKELLQTFS